MFRDIVQGAIEVVRDFAGETATYSRSPHSVTIKAVPGNAANVEQPSRGLSVAADEHEWLVKVTDLVLNGTQATPKKGDRLVVVRGGISLTYTVTPRNGEQPFRTDPTGGMYRIHTKLTAKD